MAAGDSVIFYVFDFVVDDSDVVDIAPIKCRKSDSCARSLLLSINGETINDDIVAGIIDTDN
jgi:hypothetical protein